MADIGQDIVRAKHILGVGNLVAIPTETVYGLAANAFNEDAVLKIFKVKNRPAFDPLIVHVADKSFVDQIAEDISSDAHRLINTFWPGPLTIILKRKRVIPDLVTSGLETVGVRCPDHPLTLNLLKSLNFPLAAPSANPFGYISPTSAQHVNDQLGNQIEYILDGGESKIGLESTIIGFEDNKPVIYRLGGLSIESISSVIGKVEVKLNQSSNPVAPGQLKSHYAPRKKLVLGNIQQELRHYSTQRIGILAFNKTVNSISIDQQEVLSLNGSLDEAAKRLFGCMRKLDQLDIDVILAEPVPDIGLGKAINDRLKRASAH